jgi:periplasmic glucans biosynthesis protein
VRPSVAWNFSGRPSVASRWTTAGATIIDLGEVIADSRVLRTFANALVVLLALAIGVTNAPTGHAQQAVPDPLFDKVAAMAEKLAAEPYAANRNQVSGTLANISYDDYRKIRFKADSALWRGKSLFEVQFFHPGFLYRDYVTIHEVDGKTERAIPFDPSMFRYDGGPPKGPLPKDMGFAGFRIHYPLHSTEYKDELIVFLGASYFRVLGRTQVFGMSARGLAVDTAEPTGEEFPSFREFWLVKPAPQATVMTVYALLDSASVTGVYRFDIHPGNNDTVVDVRSSLFTRAAGKKLGIAPLTSMFLFGENRTRFFDDFRPEVHDSDGLLVHTGAGEWIWRPLVNPAALRVSDLLDNNPKGFGLMQRDRDFDHYLEPESKFQLRPSLWIEPQGGGWGKGAVQLVEIPSNEEVNDNIVAYWVSDSPVEAGQRLNFRYAIYATDDGVRQEGLGYVRRTRSGWGAVPGTKNKPPETTRRFVVDFGGANLDALPEEQPVSANLSVSSGQVSDIAVEKLVGTGEWRVAFRLSPDGDKAADMRLFLTLRDERLTETWNYVWSSDELP